MRQMRRMKGPIPSEGGKKGSIPSRRKTHQGKLSAFWERDYPATVGGQKQVELPETAGHSYDWLPCHTSPVLLGLCKS